MYQRYLTGNYGESLLQLFFTMLGYEAKKPKLNGCGDLRVSKDQKHLCIEVKTAHKGKDNKWRFTLEKSGHKGITEHIDYLVLIAITDDNDHVFFVIPSRDIRGRRHIVITSNPKTYDDI